MSDEPTNSHDNATGDTPPSELSQCAPDHHPWHRLHLWQIAGVRDLFWIAFFVFLVWFGYALRSIFTPVLIGLALAYVFHPLITYCQNRWPWPWPHESARRPMVIGILLAIILLIGTAVLTWLTATFIDQTVQLAAKADAYIATMKETAEEYDVELGDLPVRVKEWSDQVLQDRGGYVFKLAADILQGTGKVAGGVTKAAGVTTYILMTLALIPIYFFFFAWQFGPLTRQFKQYIPASSRDETLRIIERMDKAVSTFFRDRLFIGLIMGVMFSIGWWLCGVPYWFLLGMGAGLLSLVPFLAGVMWPLAVILKWLDLTTGADAAGFDTWAIFVWPSFVYVFVQFVEGWFLTPYIQGKSMEMSVVTVIIVVFIGGAVGGMYGLLLCIPVAACIKILMQEVFLPRLRTWAAAN